MSYSDGYIKNIFTDNDHAGEYHRWYVRPKVKWTPNDDMSFVFSYAHDVDNNPRTQNVVARNGETIAIAVPGAEIPTSRGTVALNAPTYAVLDFQLLQSHQQVQSRLRRSQLRTRDIGRTMRIRHSITMQRLPR